MKNLISGALFMMLLVSEAHAYTGFGICNFGKETVSSVVCYSPAVLKGTTVSGDVKVSGPLNAIEVTMASLTVTGDTDIQDVKINGPADITGTLNANRVQIKGSLSVTSDNVTLSHTTIRGELNITSQSGKPILKMQCGSTVAGAVTFVGTEGVVQITDDSVVQGNIVNGTLEFVKVKC